MYIGTTDRLIAAAHAPAHAYFLTYSLKHQVIWSFDHFVPFSTCVMQLEGLHIVSFGKCHRIEGAPHETFPNVKYDAPEEVGDDRKYFDSPIRK